MSDTIAAALSRATARLRAAGIPEPSRDARALLAHAAGLPPDRLVLERDRPLAPHEAERLALALAARARRQPVSQITGRRAFWGRDFAVTPEVLDPRPETETLIARALDGPAPRRLLDLGTGSGCIAVTLLAEWPGARGVGTDLSPGALALAARNAETHGVAERLELVASDWFEKISGQFDAILCNPPYIPVADMDGLAPDVREWEPRQALTPGGDGLDAYRRIAARLAAHLVPGGRALFEFGLGQGADVAAILGPVGPVTLHDDLTGRPRVAEVRAPV